MLQHSAIGHAYPPCKLRLSELRSMRIDELRLEGHHRGCVLVIRAFRQAWSLSSVYNAIEDGMAGVDRVAVYHVDPELEAVDVLPQGEHRPTESKARKKSRIPRVSGSEHRRSTTTA